VGTLKRDGFFEDGFELRLREAVLNGSDDLSYQFLERFGDGSNF